MHRINRDIANGPSLIIKHYRVHIANNKQIIFAFHTSKRQVASGAPVVRVVVAVAGGGSGRRTGAIVSVSIRTRAAPVLVPVTLHIQAHSRYTSDARTKRSE